MTETCPGPWSANADAELLYDGVVVAAFGCAADPATGADRERATRAALALNAVHGADDEDLATVYPGAIAAILRR